MCGRYTSTSSLTDLASVFEVDDVRAEPLPARYNVAPTDPVYAVAISGTNGPHRALGTFRWGLVPSWAENPGVGSRMINARSESIATKPAYRNALTRRRCIIPADAFYEWERRTDSDGRPAGRLPYVIRRKDGRPMAFAGLWEVWRDPRQPEGELLRTCTIITTRANDVLAPIHGRMPVVLAPPDWAAWLDRDTDPHAVEGLLVPAPSAWFDLYPVSSLVNKVGNDGPELLEPLPPPPTP